MVQGMPDLAHPRSILITGASSGLGHALALAYAGPGVHLALTGRDASRLQEVTMRAALAGATVQAAPIDVTHSTAMADFITRCDQDHPLDLVIANAGISAGTSGGAEGAAQTRMIFDTNVTGTFNTVLPALERMAARGHGQIAIMASLAGFRGLAGAPAYGASKACVKIWGEGLRGAWQEKGIAISVICPGFVRTPMTDANRFHMPFIIEADQAARIIRQGLAVNRGRIAFPRPMLAAAWALSVLPDSWVHALGRLLPRK